jgi:VanZ family protein
LPPILWSGVILAASSDLFSSSHTGNVLGEVLTWIVGHPLTESSFELLHFLLRKTAHLTAYGILGALWLRAIRSGRSGWSWNWAASAVALAAAVALIDEWHQTFVPSRTGTRIDVLIDTIGAAIAQVAARVVHGRAMTD